MELNSATESQLNNFLGYRFSINSYFKSDIATIKGKPKENRSTKDEKKKKCERHRWCCLTATEQNLQCLDLIHRFAIDLLGELRLLLSPPA